jgi:hypothetical protein
VTGDKFYVPEQTPKAYTIARGVRQWIEMTGDVFYIPKQTPRVDDVGGRHNYFPLTVVPRWGRKMGETLAFLV